MDNSYLETMISPFARERVACVCGRQIARANSRPEEKMTRAFNYPAQSFVRGKESLPALGIKTFFLSGVCSGIKI